MCGRYRRTTSQLACRIISRFHNNSWNIAPTQDVFAILFNPETQQRSLDTLRWRLIPNWAKDPKFAFKTINVRAETVDPASSHRLAFKKRRYLIPVDGFYESKKVLGGKFPHSIGMKDDSPLYSPGYEKAGKIPLNGKLLHACTIVTGESNQFARKIHIRIPVILPEEHHDAWLSGEAGDALDASLKSRGVRSECLCRSLDPPGTGPSAGRPMQKQPYLIHKSMEQFGPFILSIAMGRMIKIKNSSTISPIKSEIRTWYAFESPLGDAIHDKRFLVAWEEGCLMGTYNTLEEATASLTSRETRETH